MEIRGLEGKTYTLQKLKSLGLILVEDSYSVLCSSSSLITIDFMNKFDCSGVTQIVAVCVCECCECIAVGWF